MDGQIVREPLSKSDTVGGWMAIDKNDALKSIIHIFNHILYKSALGSIAQF